MKLKLIAAAVLAVSAGAHAAPIEPGRHGNGDFFFSIWDRTNSFTANLWAMNPRMTQDDFTSAVAAPGLFSAVFNLGADSNFQSFMNDANRADLQWNIRAVESLGPRRLHTTYTPGTLPALGQARSDGRRMITGIQTHLDFVNAELYYPGGISALFDNTEPGWAGNMGCRNAFIGAIATQGYSNCGTLANNSYATGLGMMLVTYAGTTGTFSPMFDEGFAVNAWIDGGNLQVAAVPEPGVYAMLLAGLGLMGAIARRRQNKA